MHQAAAPKGPGCSPKGPRLQPYVSQAQLALERGVSANMRGGMRIPTNEQWRGLGSGAAAAAAETAMGLEKLMVQGIEKGRSFDFSAAVEAARASAAEVELARAALELARARTAAAGGAGGGGAVMSGAGDEGAGDEGAGEREGA